MPDLSIIIVNWNTRVLLNRCLQLVYQTVKRLDFELIVVDNASTDDSLPMLRRDYPQVRLIENRENVGFARANNQAAAIAQGRYLLLLNTDTFVHEGTVETLVEHMEQHPDTGAAGCRLFYEDGTLQRSCSAFPTISTELWQSLWLDRLFPKHPVFGKYMMTYWDLDRLQEVDCVLGACMLIRTEVVKKIGLFDEQFFMYSEEVDFCYRLKQAGWKVRFVPEATAIHIWGGSTYKVPTETFLRLYKSRVVFFRKHYGRLVTALYKLILFFSSAVRSGLGSVAYFLFRKQNVARNSKNYWMLFRSVWAF